MKRNNNIDFFFCINKMYFRHTDTFYRRPVDYEFMDNYNGGEDEEDFKPLIMGKDILIYDEGNNVVVEKEEFTIDNDESVSKKTENIYDKEEFVDVLSKKEILASSEPQEVIDVFSKKPSKIKNKIKEIKSKFKSKNGNRISN